MKGFNYTRPRPRRKRRRSKSPRPPRVYPVLDIPLDKTASKSQKARTRYRITIHGETRSAMGWAKKHGIPYMTVSARLRSGWNPVDAVTIHNSRVKLIGINGKYHSTAEWARIAGINQFTLIRRLKTWSWERAISAPVKKKFVAHPGWREIKKQRDLKKRLRGDVDLPVVDVSRLKTALTS